MKWIVDLIRRCRLSRDLAEELESHIEEKVDDLIQSGMSEKEARLRARREFGNATLYRESSREVWGWMWVERFGQDLRYGLRVMRRSPGFTAIAVLSLALGIGANTAVFSLLDAVLLKSLPVPEPEQLRILTWVRAEKVPVRSHSGYGTLDARTGQNVSGSFSYPAYRLFCANVPVFSDLVAFANDEFTVTAGAGSDDAFGQFVSGNYFTGLGAQPLIGRPILPEDDAPGKSLAAVITYRYWERRFGLDPAVIGRAIVVNQQPAMIVGVMPPGFQGLYPGRAVDLFVPIAMIAGKRGEPDHWWVQIFGRLRPGVSDEAAASMVRTTLGHAIEEYAGRVPESAIPPVLLAPGSRGVGLLRDSFSTSLLILTMTASLVLLIACVNLANLLLARSAGRRREIAVRLSIGASRGRLLRQLLTESLLLAGAGGALGFILVKPLSGVLLQFTGGNRPLTVDAGIDARALAFACGLSLLTGLLFGMAPAWRATAVDLSPAIKTGGANSGSRMRAGRLLVSAQVALSILLLVGSGLFVRTLLRLSEVDLGFRPERVLTFRTDPTRIGYQDEALMELYTRLREKLAAIPGVESVGMSHHGLIQGVRSTDNVYSPGRPAKTSEVYLLYCSDSFFSTLRIPIVLGRDFAPRDGPATQRVAIVNETFAKRYFPGENPLGQTFFLGDARRPDPSAPPIQIVGIAKDAHYHAVRGPIPATAYIPFTQRQRPGQMTFVIRTVLPPLSIAGAVRRAVAEIDRRIPVAELRTQEDQIKNSLGTERLFAGLVSSFGILAALLAAIGLYGVMAYTVARRTAEIGIRIALGASRANVEWLVLRESLVLVAVGILAGIPAALALTGFVKNTLFGVTPTDPTSFAAALTLMTAVAAVAAWVPARRAANVDPMVALRVE